MSENGDLPFESIEEAILRIRCNVSGFSAEGASYPVEGLWRTDLPGDFHGSIAAVDGGSSRGPINQGQVIFIASSSLFERGKSVRRARKYQIGVLDDLWHSERISTCRETMEVKMALRATESLDPEILLLDGSLEALISRDAWTPFGARYGSQPLRSFLEDILSEMEGIDLTGDLVPLTLNQATSETVDSIIEGYYVHKVGRAPRRDELLRARIFLERYETLISLNELLTNSKRLVAVSKRSGSKIYFRSKIPDIEIVRKSFLFKTGYLRPIRSELRFPAYYGIDSSYPITITYAKLERNANPLRIEIVGEHDENSLGRIIGFLAKNSIRGYPYHLRMAHEMAKVSREEVLHLLKNLHLTERPSGREVLGE
ncbi:MAG: DNA double-strand break repair nuclease NurA [Candidatus Korarchaeum sp.]